MDAESGLPAGSAARVAGSSGAPAPSISLPKGGGAIRGMGEKFAANPVTGTGSMSVPIATSPGRSGFGPELSLTYDSGAGNGPFGFGWGLSLPAITRKTDKGLPQYQDAVESDVYVLSGAEDLVPEFEKDADGNWILGDGRPVIHDKPRTVGGTAYQVRRYRPRIEGLFARIERWTAAATGEIHWRSISKDNITTLYGMDNDSRIFDPGEPDSEPPTRIFSWLICESYDDKGGVVVYGYRGEDSARIFEDPAGNRLVKVHERNRTDVSRSAQRYLKRIRYGNREPYYPVLREAPPRPEPQGARARDGSDAWLFEVVFDYGDHDANAPTPTEAGSWPARSDSFSTYRAGFEVRTYRLCQRVLMFHHFPDRQGVGADCLVRSTDFNYARDGDPADVGNLVYTFLRSVTQTGYRRRLDDGSYDSRRLPPIEFTYTEPVVQEAVEEVDPESLENLPIGLDGSAYRWADLHGEGIPGILTEQAGAWFYKRNLSPIPRRAGDGSERVTVSFAPLETVAVRPNVALAGGAEFMDLGGDGLADVVVFDGPTPGLYEHDGEEGWQPFRPFTSRLHRDLRDPNLRLVDLDGDGHADVLITEDDAFVWYPSLEEAGFGPARRVARALDEEKGPRVVFADGTQSIHLADLSGDGLTDLVRIRNGDVCYWPNLGYGRFGAKVTMDQVPTFDHPDQFDQRRIRLADIDGSGTTDIIYLHRDGVRLYFNQSGNSWSEPQRLNVFPRVDDLVSVVPVDLLGNGTACLVWSSPLPGDATRPMRYVNLMGGQKPHLLVKTVNNLGAETRVHYAPSTKFYLQDKRNGKPWVTRLPFPVHVIERVETFDHISRNRFVTRYVYHHGYFDGEEREFRGFGMVEQFDSEAFEDYVVGVMHVEGAQELAPELHQPPVTTRTWYHTGAFLDQQRILHQFCDEYYLQEQHLPEPILPTGLSADELRECRRALKGLPLRQEIYSLDGSSSEENPYTVAENSYEIRWMQPRGDQRHGVFFPVGRESISTHYERDPAAPRVAHRFGIELDEYGNARKSCSVVYGGNVADPTLPAEVTRDQQQRYITYAETDYTPDIGQGIPGDTYRLRVPFESRSYEITGVAPGGSLFQVGELKAKIGATAPIDYEVIADGVTPHKRILSHGRTLFLDNDLNPLPLGQWDSLGLAHQSYTLAFTPGVTGVTGHYAGKVTDAEFSAAGYVLFPAIPGDANWWIPSGTALYPADPRAHFYLPAGARDPLGVETIATLDQYDLLMDKVEVKQAAWNVVNATNDYRVLGPVLMTDPNKNRSAVEHDELGMVVKTAVMGKAGSADGDTLADPTTRMEYELFNWVNNRKPNYVHTFAREQHGAANPRWQESYAYSNGSVGVAMVKAQAHPGKAFKVHPDGTKVEVDADPRWVGNGRTVLNNKGKPVKQYEPYFSTTHEYEDEEVLREIGVTPILYYDPVGRNIRTLFPNGTFARVEFNAWLQKVFDANDTVKQSQWYADRGSPDPVTQPEPVNDPERRAAWLAAKHADTPGVVHSDSLGRPVYAISDYGGGKKAAVRSESDLTGRLSKLFDQEQRGVASGFVGMAGTPIVGESAEKGRRWTFQNALGALVKTWDEHGRQFRAEYDTLHRPVSTFVQEAGQPEILFNYVVYGDRLANAEQLNLLGTAHQIFDQAGMVRLPELDFKGNPKSVERVLAKDYKNNLDWSALPGQPDVAAIRAAADPALETAEVFTASSQYDALNRPTQVTLPDATVILPRYNEANFLASLRAQIGGHGSFTVFLNKQDYDANGQRQFAQYGNEVFTRYFYDPSTFRLTNLLTYKSGADPQTQSLQNLHYTYDPVGNITQIREDAQQTHYFNNAVVKPENLYEYDAIYQLLRATGRELAGLGNDTIRTHSDLDFVPQLPHLNNTSAVRTYTEEYEYDLLGNIKVLRHRIKPQAGLGDGWTRHYRYAFDDIPGNRTNRLTATSMPGDPDGGPYSGTYNYDAYGNMTRMPHLAAIDWNFMDQLRHVVLGGGGNAYFVYGLGGQRLRKVIERNGDLNLEWIFLGAVMIFRRRRRNTSEMRFERSTVHISDNTGHIAQVDTKTRDDDNVDPVNALGVALIRYQYTNHLGSAALETDENGIPISYEEYHPYGTTAYRSAKPGFVLSLKRYRFSGKEQDEETGLYYFGARYYAQWLGRWASTDPAGFVDGPNQFSYSRNNPSTLGDELGFQASNGTAEKRHQIIPEGVDTPEEFERWARSAGIQYYQTPEHLGGNEWRVGTFRRVKPGEGGPAGASPSPGSAATTLEQEAAEPEEPTPLPESDAGKTPEPTPPEEPPTEVEGKIAVPAPNPISVGVSTYDAFQRREYESKIRDRSRAARAAVQEARSRGRAIDAWEAARESSEARARTRGHMQSRVSPGARAVSEVIDAGRDFDDYVREYSTRRPSAIGGGKAPTRYAGEIAERVAIGSGSSNRAVSAVSRATRVLGPLGVAWGVVVTGATVYNAPEGQRGRVAAGEAGALTYGAVGFQLGMAAGASLAGGVTAALVAAGIASGPIGWLVLGISIGVALLGAWAFSRLGERVGKGLYDVAQ